MKKVLALLLAAMMCLSLLTACGSSDEQQPPVDPQPDQSQSGDEQAADVKQDLADYLWEVPADASEEETLKLELRNASLINTMELLFEEESYRAYSKAATSLRSHPNAEKLAALQEAKANLVQEVSVEEGVFFIWKDFASMPIVDGESYTEEQLDSASLLGYGNTTVLVKCLLDDPAQAKGNIVICSGGAMKGRSNGSEGYPAVDVFNDLGYNCFLLQRRVEPYSTTDIFMDFGRAIRVVRYYAQQEGWGGQDMIAGMGWSGGAETLMGAVELFYGDVQYSDYDSDYVPDEIDAVSADLDVAIPVYGAGFDAACGNTNLPAFFLVHGTEDVTLDCQFSVDHYEAVKDIVPAELLLIEGAPHGFGVGTVKGDFPAECTTWVNNADAFMQAQRG